MGRYDDFRIIAPLEMRDGPLEIPPQFSELLHFEQTKTKSEAGVTLEFFGITTFVADANPNEILELSISAWRKVKLVELVTETSRAGPAFLASILKLAGKLRCGWAAVMSRFGVVAPKPRFRQASTTCFWQANLSGEHPT